MFFPLWAASSDLENVLHRESGNEIPSNVFSISIGKNSLLIGKFSLRNELMKWRRHCKCRSII